MSISLDMYPYAGGSRAAQTLLHGRILVLAHLIHMNCISERLYKGSSDQKSNLYKKFASRREWGCIGDLNFSYHLERLRKKSYSCQSFYQKSLFILFPTSFSKMIEAKFCRSGNSPRSKWNQNLKLCGSFWPTVEKLRQFFEITLLGFDCFKNWISFNL